MLIVESHVDLPVPTGGTMRLFLFHPRIPTRPHARFPGVLVFSEIYQVTGPVARFARQIAGTGYIVASPSSWHDFEGPAPLTYDDEGTDRGNRYKIEKTVASYDLDQKLAADYVLGLKTCTGKLGATGMCLGGHLAYRAAFDARVSAAVCFFATDIHSSTLGLGKSDDSLARTRNGDVRAELAMIFGKRDNHVPAEGRDVIRAALKDARCGWYEFPWAEHAFIRDELSKGRYDPAATRVCWAVLEELFARTLRSDLGEYVPEGEEKEVVC